MDLVRALVAVSMKFNFMMRSTHLSSQANINCDLISRNKVSEFLQLNPAADKTPSVIPNSMLLL